MEGTNAELLAQISTSSNHKILWAHEMATLTDLPGKLFPGDGKNKQIWQIIKTVSYILCLRGSSPFFFPVNYLLCFMLYPLTLSLCSRCCSERADLPCWDKASRGGAGVLK